MSEAVWFPKAREALYPRRGAKRRPPKVDTGRLQASTQWALSQRAARLRAGLASATPELRAVTERALAHAEAVATDATKGDPDPAVVGATLRLLASGAGDDPLRAAVLPALIAGGVAFATRALARSLALSAEPVGELSVATYNTLPIRLAAAPVESVAHTLVQELAEWELLRGHVAAAGDAERAAARDAARELRESPAATLPLRCALAFLFPEEAGWAADDARAVLAPGADASVRQQAYSAVLLASLDDADLAVALLERGAANPQGHWLSRLADFAAEAARVAGARAVAPLAGLLAVASGPRDAWWFWASDLRRVAVAVSLFPGREATEALLPLVDNQALGPAVLEYLQRHPAEAVRALGPRLLESPKRAARASELLTAIARVEPGALAAAAAEDELSAPVRAALAKLLGASAAERSAGEEATAAELPRVLASPPWRSKAPRAVPRVFADLRALPYDERVDVSVPLSPWFTEERPFSPEEAAQTDEALRVSLAKGERPRGAFDLPYIAFDRLEPARALAIWNEAPSWAWRAPEWAAAYLTRAHGLAALPGTVRLAEAGDAYALQAVAECDTPRAALAMARALRRRSSRSAALGWLARFPRAAAAGLVPLALGPLGRDRDVASDALRSLVASGHAELVRAAGEAHGPEIAAALEEALTADPLQRCPAKPPKLSAFFVAEALPRLALRSGKLLPMAAVGALGEMLQFTPVEPPYAGLAEVKAALEPRALDAFLWALLGAWIDAGGASANAWAMFALGHLGGDEIVRRLSPAIRRWPREKARPRALMGVDVLGMIGSDVALMHLAELAAKAKNVHVEDRARAILAQVAEARGLDADGLADRLVPDLGLDAEGGLTLDLGPRTFRVTFTPELEPQVLEGGKALKTLPRATKADDPAMAKAAHAAWKALREDAKAVTASLRGRLERAMCDGRTWDAPTFRALMLDHPVVALAARRLLWATVDDEARVLATFRVAEDGSLADASDAAVTLAEDAEVTLVHPLRLAPDALARWGELFGDYEVLQPFPQLTREVTRAAPDDEGRKMTPPSRDLPYHVLVGSLESRGWRRAGSNGAEGATDTYEKEVAGERATLVFSPPAYFREAPPERVTIARVAFERQRGALDPIAYSEIVRDLDLFRPR